MKKKLLATVLICLVFFTSVPAYAQDNGIMPCYNVVSAANTAISSESDGVAMNIWVCAPTTTSLDKVIVEVNLKRLSGAIAATYSQNLEKQGNMLAFT